MKVPTTTETFKEGSVLIHATRVLYKLQYNTNKKHFNKTKILDPSLKNNSAGENASQNTIQDKTSIIMRSIESASSLSECISNDSPVKNDTSIIPIKRKRKMNSKKRKYHTNPLHKRKKSFKTCEICSKKFTRKDGLQRHIHYSPPPH